MPIYEPNEESIRQELEAASRKAEAAADAPRHVRHSDLRGREGCLSPAPHDQRLIIDHACGSSWFRCVCGIAVSWAGKPPDKQRLLNPVIIPFQHGSGALRGECPNCGN